MVYQGKYYLDAASTASYDGFTLWNWRGSWQIVAALAIFRARDEHRRHRGMPIAPMLRSAAIDTSPARQGRRIWDSK